MKYAMESDAKKKWLGPAPVKCQICEKDLVDVFIDGKTEFGGRWAVLCNKCHLEYGFGLGKGQGQMYNLKTLEKIEG